MDTYERELEALIVDTLLPAYIEYCRIMGRPNPTRDINSKLLQAMKSRKRLPYLLEKQEIK